VYRLQQLFQAGSESRSVGLDLSRRPPSAGQAPLAALRGSLDLAHVQLSFVTDVGLVCVVERSDLTELKEYYYYIIIITGNLERSGLEYGETSISGRDDALVAVPADNGRRLAARRARQRRHAVDRQRLVLRSVVDDRRRTGVLLCRQRSTNPARRIYISVCSRTMIPSPPRGNISELWCLS